MNTPITKPEFCPRKTCYHHQRERAKSDDWYIRYGIHHSKCRGDIQRFRCKACGKTFSTQTFSIHYWTHSTIDYMDLAQRIYSCSSLLQIGRYKHFTYRVVQNRIRRLARNFLAIMNDFYPEQKLEENLVMDGFESYTISQYFPNNITIIVGKDSQFIYAGVHTLLRRKGRMTKQQKINRSIIDDYWQPVRKIKDDVKVILRDCLLMMQKKMKDSILEFYTDNHTAYPSALKEIEEIKEAMNQGKFVHYTYSSKLARTVDNPLFPVNYVDRQIRKNIGEHVRETVKHGREINCQMERMAVFIGMHNFFTPHRIRHVAHPENEPTHRDMGQVSSSKFEWLKERLFSHRHVFSHLNNPAQWIKRIWQFEYENPPGFNFGRGGLSNKVMAIKPEDLPRHLVA